MFYKYIYFVIIYIKLLFNYLRFSFFWVIKLFMANKCNGFLKECEFHVSLQLFPEILLTIEQIFYIKLWRKGTGFKGKEGNISKIPDLRILTIFSSPNIYYVLANISTNQFKAKLLTDCWLSYFTSFFCIFFCFKPF